MRMRMTTAMTMTTTNTTEALPLVLQGGTAVKNTIATMALALLALSQPASNVTTLAITSASCLLYDETINETASLMLRLRVPLQLQQRTGTNN